MGDADLFVAAAADADRKSRFPSEAIDLVKAARVSTSKGEVAHSACVGFGLERIELALLRSHGLDPEPWPVDVRIAVGW